MITKFEGVGFSSGPLYLSSGGLHTAHFQAASPSHLQSSMKQLLPLFLGLDVILHSHYFLSLTTNLAIKS